MNVDRSTGLAGVSTSQDPDGIRRLLDVGRALTTELDQRKVLDVVLETAREVTGARYAAVGILSSEKTELEQFLTSGIDEQTRRGIGGAATRPRGARRADRTSSAAAARRRRPPPDELWLSRRASGDA